MSNIAIKHLLLKRSPPNTVPLSLHVCARCSSDPVILVQVSWNRLPLHEGCSVVQFTANSRIILNCRGSKGGYVKRESDRPRPRARSRIRAPAGAAPSTLSDGQLMMMMILIIIMAN